LPGQKAPIQETLLKSDAYEQQVGSEMAAATREAMNYIFLLNVDLTEQEEALAEVFKESIHQIVEKGATPRDAMTQAQHEAEAILESENQ
jgi:hypothetical protein